MSMPAVSGSTNETTRCASSPVSTSTRVSNQKPIVKLGQKVKKGQIIADGAATFNGELSLGRNVLVAFMAWDGYNFEDAIIISEKLVKEDTYTSIHIEEFEIEIRETKLGKEEFTRDIPNVAPKALANLDEYGIVRVGTFVLPGDVLVGKVSPKSKSELTPEEKLLHAIFGRAGEDVKNDSLEVPSGIEGVVIETQRFSRRASMTEEERKALDKEHKELESKHNKLIADQFRTMIAELAAVLDKKELKDPNSNRVLAGDNEDKPVVEQAVSFKLDSLDIRSPERQKQCAEIYTRHRERLDFLLDDKEHKLNSLKRGDELPSGVQQMVKVYVATKRQISVGDKMAGRHGNKGVISKILPEEDMPHLADGTPVDILLNPLGVPSRMNVGQILETHLGWAAQRLGFRAVTPVFDGASEEELRKALEGGRHSGERQELPLRRPHRRTLRTACDGRLHLHVEAAPSGGRQGPRAGDGAVLADHAAAAGRQGAVWRPALRRNGSVGTGSVWCRVHPAGAAHGEVGRRGRTHEDLRVDGQGGEHAGSGYAGEL